MSANYSRNPDDLYGEEKIFVMEISVRRNGSMSVIGNWDKDLAYALQCLDAARDTIKRHYLRRTMEQGKAAIIPPLDLPQLIA